MAFVFKNMKNKFFKYLSILGNPNACGFLFSQKLLHRLFSRFFDGTSSKWRIIEFGAYCSSKSGNFDSGTPEFPKMWNHAAWLPVSGNSQVPGMKPQLSEPSVCAKFNNPSLDTNPIKNLEKCWRSSALKKIYISQKNFAHAGIP